ncbi:efflux RND transporter periplasmic adaptor subunit [Roseivivax isoporae]|uniref:Hemolysin D n=1 Tax=Roseivivax isoporae LMG 25204 TaxID=1449351 RepID=X7F548_9RHOB|nr:efflux RND transporter periplasmic adaptor subunit [Roseivivax isoporae]ETX27930.1 hemolysin D [Roseivivax isoporae LMG 25204]
MVGTSRIGRGVARIVALAASCALASPSLAQGQGGEAPPPAVEVVEVAPETVTLTATLPGRVAALDEAEVRPQVAGIIVERLFREGGRVEAGDVLYRIDPATYEASLAEARASVAQAEAQLNAAVKEAERLQALQSRNIASQQALEDAVAARDSAEAALQLAEARRAQAEIELDRTNVTARLSGEIGFSMTSPGALVTTGQAEPLATIRNIDRVYVDVTQSAAEMLRWRRGQAMSDLGGDADAREVRLRLADGAYYEETGTLTAAEPYVDPQTGVVVLRMSFDNPEKLLLPGMYVQVEMPTATEDGVFLVPQEGVVRDRRGNPQAMVVTAGDTVEARPLEILQNQGSHWVVTDGLSDGDRVVVAGFQRISPGATVTPQLRGAEAGGPDGGAPEAAAADDGGNTGGDGDDQPAGSAAAAPADD